MKKKHITIRRKLLRDYLVSILIPMIILGLVLSYYIYQLVDEKSISEVVISNNKTYDNISSSLRSVTNVMNQLKTDKVLDAKLRYHYWTYETTLPFKDYNVFQTTLDYFPDDVQEIQVYTSNRTILEDKFIIQITDELQEEAWFQDTLNLNGNAHFFFRDNALYITCMLRDRTLNKVINVIRMRVKISKFHNILHMEDKSIVLVDDEGIIISTNVNGLQGKRIEEVDLDEIHNLGSGVHNHKIDSFDKAVVTSFVPAEGNSYYKLVTFIHNNNSAHQALNVALISIGIILGAFALAVFSVTLFSKELLKKFNLVKQRMHQVARGDFSSEVTVEEGIVEFDNLFNDLDTMAYSLSDLMQKVYEISNQKNEIHIKNEEMKFKLLANQINPHFLINTLETIRMKAYINEDREVAYIVKCLGKMMRYNLEIGTDAIPIEAEIEQIENYIEIQRFRFNDRLDYKIDKSNMPAQYRLLPLLLQPLVENSIIHGFEKYHKNIEISISFHTREDFLLISVMDNGCGFREESLQEIRKQLETGDGIREKHIGIVNIHHRIQLYYGFRYGVEIYSEPDSYTQVILRLPLPATLANSDDNKRGISKC